MADNIEDLDQYIDNFIENNDIQEDDYDFFDFLLTLAFLDVAVFTAQLTSSIQR